MVEYYCSYCRDITEQEELDVGRSTCKVCDGVNYRGMYDCPKCGASSTEDTLIYTSGSKPMGISLVGGNPGCVTWLETHECDMCGNEYQFENSNC